ncbi:MAG: HNH endonuclease [Fischerella sp. CENA71]|nr:HNH endonuclease [Fischerella sp. CENA71]
MGFISRLYPENWSDLALAVKKEAKWCCQKCGLKCIVPGEDTSKLTRSERMKRTLQTHHWDRNPSNNSAENLIALCSACHLLYHQGGKSNVSRGQLSLW